MGTVWLSHSKWLSNGEQPIYTNFCIKLEQSSPETILMIQKAGTMDNGWLAASWWQSTHSHLVQIFLGKHQITQVTQYPYGTDFVPCDFWLFPKLKSSLKTKRFQTINEIQENMMGQLMAIGRTSCGPRRLLWRGLSCHCLTYNVSCILYLL